MLVGRENDVLWCPGFSDWQQRLNHLNLSRWLLVGGVEHLDYFPIYWEFHHPNWRTHIFQRGPATNQIINPPSSIRSPHCMSPFGIRDVPWKNPTIPAVKFERPGNSQGGDPCLGSFSPLFVTRFLWITYELSFTYGLIMDWIFNPLI